METIATLAVAGGNTFLKNLFGFPDAVTDFFEKQSDPGSVWLPLLGNPWPMFAITAFYLYFALKLGPNLMKNRQPYNLKTAMIIYDIYQIIANLFMFIVGLVVMIYVRYDFRCQPTQPDGTISRLLEIYVGYMYFCTRVVDFLDTVFHVLAKKFSHISALHLIHHAGTAIGAWYACRLAPGGHAAFFGHLNTFIHVLMYTYYLFAALGPKYKKYIWWKKYLTIAQLIQFLVAMIHAGQFFFIECNYPKIIPLIELTYGFSFTLLFSNFYYQTYVKKAAISSKKKVSSKTQ